MSLSIKENNNVTIIGMVRDGTGQIQDITGWTFKFRVVYPNGTLLFEKNSPTEILIVSALAGKVNIFVLPADTNNKAGEYSFELKGTDPVSNQFTLNGPAELIITETII